MERFVADQNIIRFEQRLARESDTERRELLVELLAKERMRLREAAAVYSAERHNRVVIFQLVDQYRDEADPCRRDTLRRQLIEQEDQFGVLSHRIDLVDALIAEGTVRLKKLEALVAPRSDGRPSNVNRTVVCNSREILQTMVAYRAVLAERAQTSGL